MSRRNSVQEKLDLPTQYRKWGRNPTIVIFVHCDQNLQDLSCSEVDNLIVDPANGCTTQRPESKTIKKTDNAS